MKKLIFSCFIMIQGMFGFSQYFNTEKYPVYQGTDLGLTYSPFSSTFKIWSPTADKAMLLLYRTSLGGAPIEEIQMERGSQGTWTKTVTRDLKGV